MGVPTASAEAGSRQLVSVQMLRAFAAFAVLLWHLTWVSYPFPGHEQGVGSPSLLRFGYAGVDLFFVISGFIISHVTDGRAFSARTYSARRLLRILPFYAFFTSMALVAVLVNPAWDGRGRLDLAYLLRSFAALPLEGHPYLVVGWTLEHELLFYLIVGVLLAFHRPRWIPVVLGGLFGVGIVVHVVLPGRTGQPIWDHHLFSLYQVQFLIGVLVFRFQHRLRGLGWKLPLLAGLLGFLVTGHLAYTYEGTQVATHPGGWWGLLRTLAFGLSAGLLLVAGLAAEEHGVFARRGRRAILPVRSLVLVGEASFVLYLSHYFVFGILAKIYDALELPASLFLPATAAAVVAALGFAVLFHWVVERPALVRIRRLG